MERRSTIKAELGVDYAHDCVGGVVRGITSSLGELLDMFSFAITADGRTSTSTYDL